MGDGAIRRSTARSVKPATPPNPPPPSAAKPDRKAPDGAKGWAPKPKAAPPAQPPAAKPADGAKGKGSKPEASAQESRFEAPAQAPAGKPTLAAPLPPGVREALTTSWRDWSVSEKDVAAVHRSLEGLSMSDYQQALQQLDKDGLLESYLGAMDVGQRAAFLDQAMRKGAIGALAGEKASGPFEPPASPRQYIQSPTLPAALREAVHQGNLEAAVGYHRAYSAYVDRYAEAVMAQEDAAGIRRLGAPSPMAQLSEPGLEASNPDYKAFMDDWVSRARWAPSDKPGWDAISHRMDDLTGEVRPGSYWLQLEVEVVKKDGAARRGAGLDVSVRDYGQLELAGKTSAGFEADGGVVKAGGKAEVKGGVKLQRGVHPHLEKEAELKGNLQVGAPHGPSVGVEVSSSGERELAINLDEHVGSYAKGNPKEATLEGGVKLKAELSDELELEGKIGLGMKGITEEQVANALDNESPGFFGTPPEREARVPWSQLSERAQARYRGLGYDEASWKNW